MKGTDDDDKTGGDAETGTMAPQGMWQPNNVETDPLVDPTGNTKAAPQRLQSASGPKQNGNKIGQMEDLRHEDHGLMKTCSKRDAQVIQINARCVEGDLM